MSRVWFAVTPSWTTLRTRQAVICRSRGGFSANEKEDMFASNDNWLLLTCQGSGLGILYPLTLSFVRRGIPFAETIVWRLTLLIIVLYQNIFVSSPCINNIFGPSRSESHLCRYPIGFSLLPRSLLIQKHVTFLKTLHGRRQDNTMSTLGVSQCYISPPPAPSLKSLSYAPAYERLVHALNFLSNVQKQQQQQQQWQRNCWWIIFLSDWLSRWRCAPSARKWICVLTLC